MRMWRIAEAIRRGVSYEKIHEITQIDEWFIDKFAIIVEMENALKSEELTPELLKEAKRMEFPDNVIAQLTGKTEREIHDMRHANGIVAAYKIVDTCAAEFAAETPYYYSVFGSENEVEETRDKKKVLVLGSGPIRIGQGIEFDFCSVHCTWAFAKEGYETIIVNNNPETVSTDFDIADKLYFEPLTPEDVESIVDIEKPDGAVVQFGGQTAIKLTEALMKMGVPILGTSAENVDKAEDRELFKKAMKDINQPVPESDIFENVQESVDFANSIGYPVIVRPAYTLGGTGGGIAHDEDELFMIATRGIKLSPIHQILVERSVAGWKEVEYEVMRDKADNCVIICNMENIDPVGVHTGDSIVVAPSQTLNDLQYQLLRTASVDIIRRLKIEGGCNVQYALDPNSNRYYVIEVNPRVSRSSALASKATGYPIAKVAAKVATGLTLDEIPNAVTGKTMACFEPTLDYCVIKFPRWPFEKFALADRTLGTQMKATGEVMAIDRTFEGAILKAVRSLEIGVDYLRLKSLETKSLIDIVELLQRQDDERIFVVTQALRMGISEEKIHFITGYDLWFLRKLKNIVDLENRLGREGLTDENVRLAKKYSIPDGVIAGLVGKTEDEVRAYRTASGILPTFKMVDTCSAEFEAETPYYYSSYAVEDEVKPLGDKSVIVIGSGPIRIGQGVEFDYCSVHSAWALRKAGMNSIIINNNPETVSTDFDTSDSLYFEPLTVEDVMAVIDKEKPVGVICQFGGQTAINLAALLAARGVNVLGTSVAGMDRAEDREKFDDLLTKLDIPRPAGRIATSDTEAMKVASELEFPLIVRPSYVLGGRAMEIVNNEQELLDYLAQNAPAEIDHPILVDAYLSGLECEVDAICDGKDVLLPGIMEHIEHAGVHSGDSMVVYPPQSFDENIKQQIVDATEKLAVALKCVGIMNIQFIIHNNEAYVLEVNPRASRTVPFLSKITGIEMAQVATRVILGESLAEQGYQSGLYRESDMVHVKAPVFSFSKLADVDSFLGPEMKSTGEVMGSDYTFEKALYKAFTGAKMELPDNGNVLLTIEDKDKDAVLPLAKRFSKIGYRMFATEGTSQFLRENGLFVQTVDKLGKDTGNETSLHDLIVNDGVDLVINTMSHDQEVASDGFVIRQLAIEHNIALLTSLNTADALLKVLENRSFATNSL